MILKASTRRANPVMADPTRTGNIRQGFIAEINRKTNALKRKIWDLVVTEDAFGLKTGGTIKSVSSLVGNQRFAFRTDVEKIKGLSSWFEEQVKEGILSVDAKTGDIWAADYVASAYKQGYQRAYEDLHKSDLAKSVDFYNGSRQEFLRSAFAQPESMEKIRLLASRTFQDLKGVSQDMGTQISRHLVDGMAHGRSPQQIARDMNRAITKLTNTRARAIARTEVINAHAEGQLDSFQKLGVEKLNVMAEWSTAGDDLVCPLCHPLEGVTYTIKEARGMLPRHVNCRCAWQPANVGENPKEGRTILDPKTSQEVWSGPEIRSTAEVQKAMHDSIRAERRKGSYEEARRRSTWKGADLLKMKKRPVAFVRAAGKGKFNVFAAPAPQLWNHQPTAVIRWMGKEGWNADDAKRVLDEMGVNVEISTIKTQLGAGKKGLRGPTAAITDEQRTLLTAKKLGQKADVIPKPLLPVEKLVPTPKIAPKSKVSSVYPNHRGAVIPDGIIPELQKLLDIVDVDSETTKRYLSDIAQIPAEHQKLIAKNNYRVYIGERPLPDLDDNFDLKGVKPRGWDRGTWDNVGGCCSNNKRAVTLAGGPGVRSGSFSTAWHELGHAIDGSLKQSAWKVAGFDDLQKMLVKKCGPYAGHKEEAFAIGYDQYLAIKTGRAVSTPRGLKIGYRFWTDDEVKQITSFFDDFFVAKTPTPKVVVPKIEVPKVPVSLPKVDLSKVEVPKVPSLTAPSFGDQKATALARWMGNEEWSFAEARKAADELGLDIKDSTLRTQLNAGKKGARGGAPTLTKEQSDYLKGIRGGKTPSVIKPQVAKVEVPKVPSAVKSQVVKVETPPKPKVSSVYPRHRGAVIPDGIIPELQAQLDIVDVDSEVVKGYLRELSQMPVEHQKLLAANDYRIFIGDRYMVDLDDMGHLRDVVLSGDHNTMTRTWNTVSGGFDPERGLVIVGKNDTSGCYSTIWHETGHAIDHATANSAHSFKGFKELQNMMVSSNGKYGSHNEECFAIGYDHWLALRNGNAPRNAAGRIVLGSYRYTDEQAKQLTSFFDDFFAAKKGK